MIELILFVDALEIPAMIAVEISHPGRRSPPHGVSLRNLASDAKFPRPPGVVAERLKAAVC
jgi:hypothetical protein